MTLAVVSPAIPSSSRKFTSGASWSSDIFSRLGEGEVEQTTHYKLRGVKNQMTIAHLSMTLVTLAAPQMGRSEKIRFYRTFAGAG